MVDIQQIIANVRFRCHACGEESGCQRMATDRLEFKRFNPDPREKPEIQVYCEHCGETNTLGIEDIGRTNVGSILSNFLK